MGADVSDRFIFATRLALSIVIAAGLSLWLGWENPTWAMFSVIFCALSEEGESFHKGTLRILATFIGGALALLFTALFSDQRWAFGGVLMIWVMLCGYMMQDNRRWYFWFHAAMIAVLLPLYGAEDSLRTFEVVMLRLQETILGLIVYTIVATLILPDRKRSVFVEELSKQVTAIRIAFGNIIEAYNTKGTALEERDKIKQLRNEAVQLHTSFRNRVDVSIIESFDLVENRDAWHNAIEELDAIVRMLNRLRLCLSDIHPKRFSVEMSDISLVTDEINRRLQQTASILDGADNVELPRSITMPVISLPADDRAVFDHGAMMVCLETLQDIEQHSANLLIVAAEGRGLIGPGQKHHLAKPALPTTVIPDFTKMPATLRLGTIFLMAFLAFIFIPELPGGSLVILISTVIGSFVSTKPTVPAGLVSIFGSIIITIAGVIHLVIMTKFSSFLGLGALLFIYTFIGAALFSKSSLAPFRFIALGVGVMILQITNEQTYSFYYVANIFIVFQMPFILLWLTESFPFPFRPEHAFDRLLRSYMKSFQHLIHVLQYDHRIAHGKWWRRQTRGYHLRNLVQIPDQLDAWIKVIPKAAMNDEDKARAYALSQALYDIAARMIDLNRMAETEYSPETVERMRPTIQTWREALERLSGEFQNTPQTMPSVDELSERLHNHLLEVSADMRMAMNTQTQDDARMSTSSKMLLRELSSYRGMTEALINASGHASALDWPKLHEARF